MSNDQDGYKKLNELIQQAFDLRESLPVYKQNKDFIKKLFDENYSERLTVLASLYSVERSLNKNVFLKNELMEKLDGYYDDVKHDYSVKKIYDLINKTIMEETKYGSKPTGNKIISTISKYLYFRTNYNFPIYDSYANATLQLLLKKLHINKCVKNTDYKGFYEQYFIIYDNLKQFFEKGKIKIIDQIDAFLWLYGIVQKAKTEPLKMNNNYIYYNSTCGELSKYLLNWYEDVNEFFEINGKTLVI